MAAKRSSSRGGLVVNKTQSVIQPRVQKFGTFRHRHDCVKAHFKWVLCDFYGNVLIPPPLNTIVLEPHVVGSWCKPLA